MKTRPISLPAGFISLLALFGCDSSPRATPNHPTAGTSAPATTSVTTAPATSTAATTATPGKRRRRDWTDADPQELGLTFVTPAKDPKTGFVVGGKNPTALIRTLTEINGRSIADLEKDMRPRAMSKGFEGSAAGFLGREEKLLDVLAADNQYVVDELGLTHQELARHLHLFGAIGRRGDPFPPPFRYHGREFEVEVYRWPGYQGSPFRDGTRTDTDATVRNRTNGKELKYSLLVPHLIERYGFYEGTGTPYRVDPRAVLEVFDFLKDAGKKP